MKHRDTLLGGLSDAIPLACGMLAAACAVPTSFGIGFSLGALVLFCVVSAMLLAFWMDAPKFGFGFGAIFLSGVIFVVVLLCYRYDELRPAVTKILAGLPDDMQANVLETLKIDPALLASPKDAPFAATLMLMLLAAATGLLMTGALTRGKTVLLAVMIPLPMFLFSFFCKDSHPKLWTAVLLTVYLGYTLLGNGIRKGDLRVKNRFMLLLAPLLLTLALLIIAIVPQDNYPKVTPEQRENLIQNLTESFQHLFDEITDRFRSLNAEKTPDNIDLNKEERHDDSDTQIFAISATKPGIYYLRTYSYGIYENNEWKETPAYSGEWKSLEALSSRQKTAAADNVRIIGFYADVKAVPYAWSAPADESPDVAEAGIRSRKNDADYLWYFVSGYRTDVTETPSDTETQYLRTYAAEQYRMPDGEEKDALLSILDDASVTRAGDPIEVAHRIAAFVRDSGTYVLAPGRVPKGKDFVRYFLQERHEGYCVHFASATTALLQACGYLARYTVGYYVKVNSYDTYTEKPVTKNDSHAWTEIYVAGLGWVPIESTPQFGDDGDETVPDDVSQQTQNSRTPVPSAAPETPAPTIVPASPTPAPATQAPQPAAQQEEEQETPGGEGGAAATGKKRAGLWWILIPVVPLLWFGTGVALRRIRESRFRQKNIKRAIPEMSRYLSMLQRFGVPQDPDAPRWALEAAFSNHRMREEHRELLRRVKAAQQSVYADAPVRRFLLRWVLFLI